MICIHLYPIDILFYFYCFHNILFNNNNLNFSLVFIQDSGSNKGDILMTEKKIYRELERSIEHLKREILEYIRKEKAFNEERKLFEYSHIRRTLSLMKINEELEKEIKQRTHADKEELSQVSHRLRDRIKELNCLYDISSFRDATDF